MLAVTLLIILYQIPLVCESSHIQLPLSQINAMRFIEPILPTVINSL